MPAPVEFTVRVAALTPGFDGDAQALATEISERLMITPSEPWSSFINGGAQPSSNVGPYLRNGNEWLVWSDSLGTYTYHVQNGAGLVDATVTLAKLSDGSPKSVLSYGADSRPTLISGTAGQVLTLDANAVPSFANPVTGTFFTLHVGTDQDYVSDGVSNPVHFDTIVDSSGVTPDTANFRVPIPANSTWFFGVSLQIENINGPTSDVQHYVGIRPYQLDAIGLGSIHNYFTAVSRDGAQAYGVYRFITAGYVDVVVASTDPAPGTHFSVSSNGNSTRFFGHRLA